MLKSHGIHFSTLLSILLIIISANCLAKSNKGIVGKIDAETGHYTAIDKSFQVTLPIKGTQRYVTSAITDIVSARGTIISIEPKKDAGTYRLETSHAVTTSERNISFPEASAKTIDWYRRLATRYFQNDLIELITQPFTLNGRQAISAIYKQLSTKETGPRYHLFYLVDFGTKLAFVWTDIPLEADDLDIEDKIISGNAEQAKKSIAMLRSLRFEF